MLKGDRMTEEQGRHRSWLRLRQDSDVEISVKSRLKLRDTHGELVKARFYGPQSEVPSPVPTQNPRRPLDNKPSNVVAAAISGTASFVSFSSTTGGLEQAASTASSLPLSQSDRHQLSPSILHFLIAAGSLGAFILIIFIVYVSLKIRSETVDVCGSSKSTDDEKGPIDWQGAVYESERKQPNGFGPGTKRLDRILPMQQLSAVRSNNNISTFEQHPSVRAALVRTNSNVSKMERHFNLPPAVARSNSQVSRTELTDRELPTLPPIPGTSGSNVSNRELLDRKLPTIPLSVARSNTSASAREPQGLVLSQPRIPSPRPVHTSFYHSHSHSASSPSAPSTIRETDSVLQCGQSPPDSTNHYIGWISGDEAPSRSVSEIDLKELGGRDPQCTAQPPQISRFSWTNSQPQTPRTTRTSARTSVATSIESVPHFRTVNSWVNHQTTRLERQHARGSGGADFISYDRDDVPIVPEQYRRRSASSGPGRSTPSAFRQHPGQRVIFGEGSRVASEVLDLRIGQV